MRKWKQISRIWKNLGITVKFNLVFGVLLTLIVLIIMVSFTTLSIVRRETDTAIINTNTIQRQVLDMDRSLEKAKRLEKQFFLQYPIIGYSAAYEKYALPAAEQVLQVAEINTELRQLISRSEMADIWQENDVNINLYFLAVDRHITSVAEATQLVAELAEDEIGLLAQMRGHSAKLLGTIRLANDPDILILYYEMQSFEKDYYNTHQRSLMQSAFNHADSLRKAFEDTPILNADQKTQTLIYLDQYLETATEIIEVDVAIQGKFNEFDLQAEAIDPITEKLLALASLEVERAQRHIRQLGQTSNLALFTMAIIGLGSVLAISFVLNKSITQNIIILTDVTAKFQRGELDVRAHLDTSDELGQLAASYNSMAARLGHLIENLEQQVEERTKDLEASRDEALSMTNQVRQANQDLQSEIEERVRAEEEKLQMEVHLRQQQKLESIGTLASGVAHEINNPIMGIMNYATLISERLDPSQNQLREFAHEIGHETERVAEIVRNLLVFSRQEKQEHSPAQISNIVDGTISLIRTVIKRDQITLEVDVPEGLPQIKCRSQQIQQVLMNLLTNARDAVNARYPEYDLDKIITLNVNLFEKEGRRWLRTTVEDHGVGIPVEIRERIFDPFYTTKDRAIGTGLGLSISLGIVKDHHGELSFESEEGQPTRFHLDLPVDNGWDL